MSYLFLLRSKSGPDMCAASTADINNILHSNHVYFEF
jgi:hypothetical protein